MKWNLEKYVCEFWDLHIGVAEHSILLRYDAASDGSGCPLMQHYITEEQNHQENIPSKYCTVGQLRDYCTRFQWTQQCCKVHFPFQSFGNQQCYGICLH